MVALILFSLSRTNLRRSLGSENHVLGSELDTSPADASLCNLRTYRSINHQRRLCSSVIPTSPPATCVIVSLVAHTQPWTFESAVLESTVCRVAIFACSPREADFPVLKQSQDRLEVYHTCIGASDSSDQHVMTWRSIARRAMGNSPQAVQIVALNVESPGSEYEVYRQVASLSGKDLVYRPLQIAASVYTPLKSTLHKTGTPLSLSGYSNLVYTNHTSGSDSLEVLLVRDTVLAMNDRIPVPGGVFSLGDRFGMQIKYRSARYQPERTTRLMSHMRATRTKWPRDGHVSIMGFYAQVEARDNCSSFDGMHLPPCIEFPSTHRLRLALKDFGTSTARQQHAFDGLNQANSTLLVHLRSGDRDASLALGRGEEYVRAVKRIVVARNFKQVRVFGAAHNDTRYARVEQSAERYRHWIAYLMKQLAPCKVSYHVSISADDDLYQASISSNIFVHFGGFSMLMALAANGNVFSTPALFNLLAPNFTKEVSSTGKLHIIAALNQTTVPAD